MMLVEPSIVASLRDQCARHRILKQTIDAALRRFLSSATVAENIRQAAVGWDAQMSGFGPHVAQTDIPKNPRCRFRTGRVSGDPPETTR